MKRGGGGRSYEVERLSGALAHKGPGDGGDALRGGEVALLRVDEERGHGCGGGVFM